MNAQTSILPFSFSENDQIRSFIYEDTPWFIASDICKVLGLKNTSITIKSVDEDSRSKFNLGRQGNAWCVNEDGLYTIVLRCDDALKEGTVAYRFRRWVTKEVLPAIRKHGAYVAPHKEDDKSFIETFKNFCLQHNYSAREVEMFNWFGEMKLKQGYAIAMSKVEKEREEVKEQQPQTLPVPYDDVKRILLLAAYLSDRYNRYVNAVAAIRELISSLNIIKEDISDLAYLGDIQMPLLKQKLLDLPFTDEQRKEIEHALRPWAVEVPAANNK